MTTHEQYGLGDESTVHEAVGAYVLGILDDAEATAFEAHLAGCRICAVNLEEFSGMEPMLAMLADSPAPFAGPGSLGAPGTLGSLAPVVPLAELPTPSVSVQPSPQLLGRLVDEVAAKRAQRRRRGMYLVAAAAALIIGGPVVAVTAAGGDGGTSNQAGDPHPTSPAEDAFFNHMPDKVWATDATTKVSATIGMEPKGWGTHTVLELKNVKGPLKCSLVAVSKTGEEEVVTSWSVPKWGYGIADSPNKVSKSPLYVHGGTAMDSNDIDHFEVRTFDGERLVEVDA
ncbi:MULTISPECIES: zf-HC2 domain-containing protein [unclassified Streptomyces]|uniref:zf-HC2 domain-containing protein n=1 Tax=unclassified Streptomyces TaxID=2593676 RepID=UPI00081E33F7|nr:MULTISPECIES: zf-HC2 domain-containing protein [unclassified Streptomyces]MYZ39212.1 RNA polymerase subunit sigma [Streptomyces sp. SID4917]SCG02713.1 Putative zinc-finger [Streptomyces sp. MnatMP-M17]